MENLNKTFYELETSLLDPKVRASREKLEELLAQDFIEFGSSGRIYKKADTLKNLPESKDKIEYTISNFEARELSECLVQTTFVSERVINGTDKTRALRSSLWKKIGSRWQIIFHQGTLTK